VPRSDLTANPIVMAGRLARLEGYLGRFRAAAYGKDNAAPDLGPFSPNADGCFDLVLDLNTPPLLTVALRPPGYYAPSIRPDAIAAAIVELRELSGTFTWPRHIDYSPVHCTHAAQGVTGCTRCLATCPASALGSVGGRIVVSYELCHGCAACTLACPTGALRYRSPSDEQSRERLTALLAAQSRAGLSLPRVLLYQATDTVGTAGLAAGFTLAFAVPHLPALGVEFWLDTLAEGVPQLVVQMPARLPARLQHELRAQIELGQALLAALGEAPERIMLAARAEIASSLAHGSEAETAGALETGAGANHDKRDRLNAALDRLQTRVPTRLASPAPEVELPSTAPFGTVELDAASCTLCRACTNLCSTGALSTDAHQVSLRFTESRCVQCRTCERACPEHALSVRARWLRDPLARGTPRLLKEDMQHRCPGCHSPFIGRQLLAKSMQLMRQQRMFGEAQVERLLLCPTCRINRCEESLDTAG
jgi:Fe-S-cluster-containing hydrogenase component 2